MLLIPRFLFHCIAPSLPFHLPRRGGAQASLPSETSKRSLFRIVESTAICDHLKNLMIALLAPMVYISEPPSQHDPLCFFFHRTSGLELLPQHYSSFPNYARLPLRLEIVTSLHLLLSLVRPYNHFSGVPPSPAFLKSHSSLV